MAAIFIMAADNRNAIGGARSLLSMAVYPLQLLTDTPIQLVERVGDSFSSYSELLRENQRLREEIAFLKTRQLKYAALEQENIRLRNLLDAANKLERQMLVAALLSIRLDPYQHVVLVNKGTQAGVSEGQTVLDENGVAGQVLRASPLTSEVILITDPNHAIPIQVNRNGLLTIAMGGGQINQLILPYLPNNADIQVGDLLVTSGLGGVFPPGYPVATVTKVEPQSGRPFSMVTATPLAKLDRSRELLITARHDTGALPAADTPPGAPADGRRAAPQP